MDTFLNKVTRSQSSLFFSFTIISSVGGGGGGVNVAAAVIIPLFLLILIGVAVLVYIKRRTIQDRLSHYKFVRRST